MAHNQSAKRRILKEPGGVLVILLDLLDTEIESTITRFLDDANIKSCGTCRWGLVVGTAGTVWLNCHVTPHFMAAVWSRLPTSSSGKQKWVFMAEVFRFAPTYVAQYILSCLTSLSGRLNIQTYLLKHQRRLKDSSQTFTGTSVPRGTSC